MAERDGYTVQKAAKIIRVPERSITFWAGPARVLIPEIARGGRGRGNPKRFSPADFVGLRVTHELTQRWIALKTVRALMTRSRDNGRQQRLDPDYSDAARAVVWRGPRDWSFLETGVGPAGWETIAKGLKADFETYAGTIVIVPLTAIKRQIRKAIL